MQTAREWDERYQSSGLVWSAEPNCWVRQYTEHLAPGTALDLASGEGRNALWLADHGWEVTAIDFSEVATRKARERDTARRVRWITGDVLDPAPGTYDLVLVIYLQVPAAQRRTALRNAAAAVAEGGRLLVVAHHSDNLTLGTGGPQDPDVLYTESDVLADVPDLTPLAAGRAERPVAGSRPALDLVVELRR